MSNHQKMPDKTVSKHGAKRMRGRLGLPKRAHGRTAKNALLNGIPHTQYGGAFRRYLNRTMEKKKRDLHLRVYKGSLYLFSNDNLLITVWRVPEAFRKNLKHKENKG